MYSPDDPMVKQIVETVRSQVRGSDQLPPTFFIGNQNQQDVVIAMFTNEEEKDQLSVAIEERAKKIGADYVLFVSESYTIRDQEGIKEYLGNKERYGYQMSNHPSAVEIVYFSLETPFKTMSGVGWLNGREMGEVEWNELSKSTGRFANFLGAKPTVN